MLSIWMRIFLACNVGCYFYVLFPLKRNGIPWWATVFSDWFYGTSVVGLFILLDHVEVHFVCLHFFFWWIFTASFRSSLQAFNLEKQKPNKHKFSWNPCEITNWSFFASSWIYKLRMYGIATTTRNNFL